MHGNTTKIQKQPTPVQLKKHTNFNINRLRDNTAALWIDHHNTARNHAQQQMTNLMRKENKTRADKDELLGLVKGLLYIKKKQESQ